jgi:hypothetical protein
MLISTALLLDSNIRNSVCTPAKLPCRRVEVGVRFGSGTRGSRVRFRPREVVLSRGYGHIQQSIVRAEVFAGKMKSTHSVAVIPTL